MSAVCTGAAAAAALPKRREGGKAAAARDLGLWCAVCVREPAPEKRAAPPMREKGKQAGGRWISFLKSRAHGVQRKQARGRSLCPLFRLCLNGGKSKSVDVGGGGSVVCVRALYQKFRRRRRPRRARDRGACSAPGSEPHRRSSSMVIIVFFFFACARVAPVLPKQAVLRELCCAVPR